MSREIISPEKGVELKRLLEEHQAADKRARAIGEAKGTASPEFAEADKVTTDLWRRIRELQGMAGQNWMA